MTHPRKPALLLGAATLALIVVLLAGRDPAAGGEAGVPAWPDTLLPADAFAAPSGMTAARTIIHVHSVFSHDACDGEPQTEAGSIDRDCLERFRRALCFAKVDAVFLTEHDRYLVRADSIAAALMVQPGDIRLKRDGRTVASRIACPGGASPILFPGAENVLMPVAFDSLPSGDHEARRAFYDAGTDQSAELFHRYGAVVLLSHPEDLELERIAELDPDGIEIYNPHANFAPRHREAQGLSPLGAIGRILPFYLRLTDAHPDLALLPLFQANRDAIDDWDGLLASRPVFGFGASDAHENSLPWPLADGDRGDSYFRLIPWVTNVFLLGDRNAGTASIPVAGPAPGVAPTPAAIEAALRRGRFYVALEAWGTPAGFDFRLEQEGGSVVEMGGSIPLAAGQRLIASPPTVAGRSPALPVPEVRMRLYRIDPSGARTIVADRRDEAISAAVPGPGAYRVEAAIVPRHLTPYLGDRAEQYLREVIWIYSNPIRVTP